MVLAILVSGCGDRYPFDDVLRLNHVQARGTHNSYHLQPEQLFDASHAYSHAPLDVQLGAQGVRQLELDLHLSVRGHLEVFHLPGGIDEETTCRRFIRCLETVRSWSDAHPEHLPIVIWLEPKDEALDWADDRYDMLLDRYDLIEAEILAVWSRPRLITPDRVRGSFATLREAVLTQGWPTLGEVRGQVLFALLDRGTHREAYRRGAPDLRDRLLFIDTSDAEDPEAAIFKINNAGQDAERVEALARAGFLITSNADGPEQPDEANAARRDGALAAGAHFLSSDYPAPGEGYWLEIPGGSPARCHPHTAPPECRPERLEQLR